MSGTAKLAKDDHLRRLMRDVLVFSNIAMGGNFEAYLNSFELKFKRKRRSWREMKKRLNKSLYPSFRLG
jgi:hypothetical protein